MRPDPPEPKGVPPIAWSVLAPILLFATAGTVFAASRYHLFGDELYFIAAGAHPSVSYADQGPILPLLAAFTDALPGDSLIVFRLPSIILTVIAVGVTGLIAREMGGGRTAQALAALAYGTSTLLLLQANLLATNAIDAPLWVIITWGIVRWVRTRQDRLLLVAALVTALDLQAKWLVPVLWIGVVVGVAAVGPRDLLRRPLLWVGGLIVVISAIPSIVWQATHDWPQLQLSQQVAVEQAYIGGRLLFLPLLIVFAGALGVPLLVAGLWRLFRNSDARPYRFLGIAFLVVVVIFLAVNGRPYYPAGMLAVVMAAGAVGVADIAARRRSIGMGAGVVAATSLVVVVVAMPWKPADQITQAASVEDAAAMISVYGQFGWPELTRDVRGVVGSESADPTHPTPTAIVSDSYWQAGALEYYGSDLPPVYSPSRGFGYLGTPPDSATSVLWVDASDNGRPKACAAAEPIRTITGRLAFPGAATDVTIWRCSVATPWSQQWTDLQHI
ncbi:hypothetical protein GS4_05_03460 [Gordonia soli NBRC 108243]|uniref:Glycosyltransferase RgtA/B/C/D-like domain-containing protein n=1 Tax=Gordonia soli NBRC 108243 TaxID=1223545 RepID=M0QI77_9ACTN|nr:hypothetical protein GS4_05_03460 [Gordonia soli NBRC 108243]